MIDTIRSEWIKIRTVRAHWVLMIIAIVFPLVVTTLTSILISATSIDPGSIIRTLVGTAFVSTILYGVLGVLTITSDYQHHTIRPTFAATPRRTRVMLAKAIVVASTVTVIHAVLLGLGYTIAKVITTQRFEQINFSEFREGGVMLLGSLIYAPLIAVIGLGVGSWIRNQATALTLFIIWPLLGEGLLSGLLLVARGRSVMKFLPFRAGSAMVVGGSGEDTLTRFPAGVVFAIFAVLIMSLGLWMVNRRDA